MSDQELIESLQQIVSQNLIATRHSAKAPDFQITQFQKIKDSLASVYQNRPDLLQVLQKGVPLIAASKLTRPQIDNIGVASHLCLEHLLDVEMQQVIEPDGLREIIVCFLNLASIQSRNELKQRDKSTDVKQMQQNSRLFVELFNRFINESVSEMAMQQRSFDSRFAEATEKIDSALKAAEKAAVDAERAAQSTQSAAIAASTAETAATNANKSLSDIEVKLTTAQGYADRAADKAKAATQTAEGMIPNMLTVLGIFIGVIIAVVACYLTIVLEKDSAEAIAAKSMPLAFMFAWMMGHVLILSVFMLLYMIARLTDRRISTECANYQNASQKDDTPHDCSMCAHKLNCRSVDRLKSRFPYIFWINVLFGVGYLIILAAHILDTYYKEWFMTTASKHPGGFAFISFGAIFVSIAFLLGWAFWPRKRKQNP